MSSLVIVSGSPLDFIGRLRKFLKDFRKHLIREVHGVGRHRSGPASGQHARGIAVAEPKRAFTPLNWNAHQLEDDEDDDEDDEKELEPNLF